MRNFIVSISLLMGFATTGISQSVVRQNDYIYPANIDYKLYQTTSGFTPTNSIGVMGLTIKDPGGDNLPTTLTEIIFSVSTTTANAVGTAALFYKGAKVGSYTTVVKNTTSIGFKINSGVYPSALNGDTANFELRVTFKNTNTVIDNHQMQFTVSSVKAAAGGSSFIAPDGGGAVSAVSGNLNRIRVTADRYKFGEQPTEVFAGQMIMPTVTVKAVDIYNNHDSDYVSAVKLNITNPIPSCDTLAGNLVTAVSGTASFPVLSPNVAEFNVTLTATGSLSNVISTAFDVNSAQYKNLIFWKFGDNNVAADGGTNTNYLTKNITSSSTGTIAFGACGCIGDREPAAFSTGWENGSGNKYWQIDFASLGYWKITVSSRQRSTPTGPKDFKAQYKVGNGVWEDVAILSAMEDSFKSRSISIPELDAPSQVYVRWIMTSNKSVSGGTVDNAGLNFMDDINVQGIAITAAKELNYRSTGSGDFESSCNWETATTPAGPWSQAKGSPDFTAFIVTVQAGHSITINQSVNLDQMVVETGATLIINKGELFILNGNNVSGLEVKGTFIDNTINDEGVTFSSTGTWKLGPLGTFIKTGNSSAVPYRNKYAGGMSTIPATANWILRYKGLSAPAFTTDSTFYPNLTIESTSGLWNPGATTGSYFSGSVAVGAFATIKGNLDIGGTGNSGTVKISNTNTNAQPMLVLGSTLVRSGSELNNSLASATGTGFEVRGNITAEGTLTANGNAQGTFKLTGSALQTISGGGIINLQNLSVNNTGAGIALAKNLAVNGTTSLILGTIDEQANTLTLGGQMIFTSGKINGTLGTTEFTAASVQTISANAFVNNTINNVVIGNNVNLTGQQVITGILSFIGSNKTLSTNNNLTLRSTATKTANVSLVANGNKITGDVTVERYISAKRAWRLLAVPTTTAQTVKQAWQEGATSTGDNFSFGYGTQVTDQSAIWASNGFDFYSPDGPSIKKYNSAINKWVGIANTGIPIKSTQGLMTFVRGDRRSTGIGSTSYPTVLRTKGPLNAGVQPVIMVTAGQSVSVANPYASAIDLRKLSKTGITETFIVWDPYLANTNGLGVGGFQYLYKDGANYYASPGGGTYPSINAFGDPTGTSNYIESGQAFFVQSPAGGPGGTVTFDENVKADVNANPLVFRPASNPAQRLHVNLYALDATGSASLLDGTLNEFGDKYNKNLDEFDVLKVVNFSENLSIDNEDHLLSIERMPAISREDTVQLNMDMMKVKSYTFEIIGNNFTQPGLTAFLEDAYLNTRTPLDLTGSTTVNFTIADEAGSWNPLRFRIVLKAADVAVLPVTFSSVKASRQVKSISVEWKIANEKNSTHYVVERSANGQRFTEQITLPASIAMASAAYQWTDINPFADNNYYRIKSLGKNGEVQYSTIVKVENGTNIAAFAVYPNPVVNGTVNLQLRNQPKGTYVLKLMNNAGQVIERKQVNHQGGNSTETLQLNRGLAKGTYRLQVLTPDNNKTSINVLYR